MKTYDILGTNFTLLSYSDVMSVIRQWRRDRERHYVTLTPPHSVLMGCRDVDLRRATERAGLTLPDGVGIILAARLFRYPHRGRVTGPTLMLRLSDWGRAEGLRHFYYGGAPGVAEALAERLTERYRGLDVVGTYSPPFRELTAAEDVEVTRQICEAKPDIVWVGLGSPKQEKWMAEHADRIDAALIGVGAAFDFHSGRVKWAPRWMRNAGFEWAYRLATEPRRMWRRNVNSIVFLAKVLRQRSSRTGNGRSSGQGVESPVAGATEKTAWALSPSGSRPLPFGRDWAPGTSGPSSVRKEQMLVRDVLSVDVEEWFHVLNAPAAPRREAWPSLEGRIERNMDEILSLLESHDVRATFFWLGWVADRYKALLRRCSEAGHEIASHGYDHVLPEEVGPQLFREDITRAKSTLEDIVGRPVEGFRSAGFAIDGATPWFFDVVGAAGYQYDSSVFPSRHGRDSEHRFHTDPYLVQTETGLLVEVPVSTVTILGRKVFLFGGGYLRLAPLRLIRWGVGRLRRSGSSLVVYIHPREVDVDQPRMSLGCVSGFRYYVNLKTTMPKLQWLCRHHDFTTMKELIQQAGLELPSAVCVSDDGATGHGHGDR